MACNHLDELASELITAGIMTNAERLEPRVWNGEIVTSRRVSNIRYSNNKIFDEHVLIMPFNW